MRGNETDRTLCIPGETVIHKIFVEGGLGINETDIQAVACGSNSGCIGIVQ
jgi:hypothetical protein